MDLRIRELEQASIKLIPNVVVMAGDTILTQYIITKWALEYRNECNTHP